MQGCITSIYRYLILLSSLFLEDTAKAKERISKLHDYCCRGGGGWVGVAAVQGEPDGHGRLHVHRQERGPARRQQEDPARHRL